MTLMNSLSGMTPPEVSGWVYAVLPILYFLFISFPFSHCCFDLCWEWLLGSDVTMALKKVLRNYDLQIIKDFGIRESLPLRPLMKCDILTRYSSIRQNSVNIPVLTHWQIAYKLVEEIEELYKKFGLKTVTKINASKKVLAIKNEYYKWRKKVHLKTFPISDVVSFRAPKQPREVLKDDLNWYEAKLKGEAGCLGSVDRKASKRSQYRVKRKSMAVVCIHKSALLERLSSISIPNYMGIQSVKWVPLLQCHLSKPFVIIYVIWVTT